VIVPSETSGATSARPRPEPREERVDANHDDSADDHGDDDDEGVGGGMLIGTAPNYAKFRFTDAPVWEDVRSQIINAMNLGKRTIEFDRKGDKVVYVYSPFLPVSWVETGV
jgi:hypothetical protein